MKRIFRVEMHRNKKKTENISRHNLLYLFLVRVSVLFLSKLVNDLHEILNLYYKFHFLKNAVEGKTNSTYLL